MVHIDETYRLNGLKAMKAEIKTQKMKTQKKMPYYKAAS